MIERIIARMTRGVSRRAAILLAVLLAVLLAAPWIVNDYLLTVLIIILYFAYTGQAWNIMMGFAGQLSLGHALYLGLGGYVAAMLFTQFGIAPWLGLLAAIPIAAASGAVIGFLAFRFRVAGVYFAILTIAFAEFARIGFDNWNYVNASSGLFLPVRQYAHNDAWRLRGDPTMFYYVILAATVAVFVLCNSSLLDWISSFAERFPEQVFSIARSVEIILGPIIGGIGTLFGPILGAFVLTGLAETLNSAMTSFGIELPGARQVFYGICLLIVVVALPDGVWPPLARRLGVGKAKK